MNLVSVGMVTVNPTTGCCLERTIGNKLVQEELPSNQQLEFNASRGLFMSSAGGLTNSALSHIADADGTTLIIVIKLRISLSMQLLPIYQTTGSLGSAVRHIICTAGCNILYIMLL